jgi:N-acetylglucosamine-6-phosphate deacetylase
MKAIVASRLFDGFSLRANAAVLLEGADIATVVAPDAIPSHAERIVLASDRILAPGFVDLQVNGGGGAMFNDAPETATLSRIADAHAALGTTAILPTLISSDAATRSRAIAAGRAALAESVPGIAGLHIEGPFLNPSRHGIHPPGALALPSEADLAELCAPFPAPMLITLAPEIVGSAVVARLAAAGRTVFAGHSDASFAEAEAGFDAGIRGATHLFNAMSQLGSRAPGLVGAALLHGMAGIIVDLLHVDAASIRIAHRMMGPRRLFLVSDAMSTVGGGDSFVIGGKRIVLRDGRLCDEAGTLAGAHLTMAEAVGRAVRDVGIPLEDALQMATSTPADAVGLARLGRIAARCPADLVELDSDLAVRRVWRGGEALGR